MEKRFPVLVTKRQAQAVRSLISILEENAPRGINVRSLMWPEISIAQRLAANIEMSDFPTELNQGESNE